MVSWAAGAGPREAAPWFDGAGAVSEGDERVQTVFYGLIGLQILWVCRPYLPEMEALSRWLGDGGSAFKALARVLVSLGRGLF